MSLSKQTTQLRAALDSRGIEWRDDAEDTPVNDWSETDAVMDPDNEVEVMPHE